MVLKLEKKYTKLHASIFSPPALTIDRKYRIHPGHADGKREASICLLCS